MDKFRAAEYFIAAAKEGTLSGGARRLEVSVAAVSKVISGLEKQLGARLFERRARGLSLTPAGLDYLDACQQALSGLSEAERALKQGASSVGGVLTVGAPAQLGQHWIVPALPSLHRRYPDLRLDLYAVNRVKDATRTPVDIFVLLGWHEEPNMVRQMLGASRLIVCASPEYWARQGVPTRPEELANHTCQLYRNPFGTVLDLWDFEKDGERVSIPVSGWLCSDHRDNVLDSALAGHGVVRLTELTCRPLVAAGRLVPVLMDWHVEKSPPVQLLYPPSSRSVPRVRVFIDFLVDLFANVLDQQQPGRPEWYGRPRARPDRHRPC